MKQLIYITIAALFLTINVGADEKLNFGTCSAEVQTHCSAGQDEHAKHGCLAKLDESKLSKGCLEYRKNLALKDLDKKGDKHKGHTH